jgi:redox-sensitive bicupin YhaK (pirin superfamily)
VRTFSETLLADAALEAGARLVVPRGVEERAVFVAAGAIDAGGERHEEGRLLVLRPEPDVELVAPAPARVIVLGGEPMDGPRHVWWNFVSSSRERIEEAKRAWAEGTIGAVPGDPERIPLPDEPRVPRTP